MKEEEKA